MDGYKRCHKCGVYKVIEECTIAPRKVLTKQQRGKARTYYQRRVWLCLRCKEKIDRAKHALVDDARREK